MRKWSEDHDRKRSLNLVLLVVVALIFFALLAVLGTK